MVSSNLIVAATFAAVPLVALAAQDPNDLVKQIVNDPGAPEVSGAKASLVDDPKVEGGKALRIQVPRKGSNPCRTSISLP